MGNLTNQAARAANLVARAGRKLERTLQPAAQAVRSGSFTIASGTRYGQAMYALPLRRALRTASNRSDVSDHLSAIFCHTIESQPRLIVELGTRGGESTRALLAAANVCRAQMLSVDIEDCSHIDLADSQQRWSFEQGDDVAFAGAPFAQWCAGKGLPPHADVIFVDTSNLYEHSVQELQAWAPRLAPRGLMMFHDTNMGSGVYARLDGSVSADGWDNERGVIRAIEEYVGRRYDEKTFFADLVRGWLIRHYPNCNGLTLMRRVSATD